MPSPKWNTSEAEKKPKGCELRGSDLRNQVRATRSSLSSGSGQACYEDELCGVLSERSHRGVSFSLLDSGTFAFHDQ